MRSIFRFIVLCLTFGFVKLDKVSDKIEQDPDMAYRAYMNAAKELGGNAESYGNSLAIQQNEYGKLGRRIAQLRQRVEELVRNVKKFAALRDKRLAEFQAAGLTPDQIKEKFNTDADLKNTFFRWKDDSSTLKQVQEELTNAEELYKSKTQQISDMEVQFQRMLKLAKDAAAKAEDARAKLIAAKSQAEADKAAIGVDSSGVMARLQHLDDMVATAVNKAANYSKVAAIQTGAADQRLDRAAEEALAADEFLSSSTVFKTKTDEVETSPRSATPLPEGPAPSA